jgi:N4-gp56 family major capsid protein
MANIYDTSVWPTPLQPMIQTNWLMHEFENYLVPNLAFRPVADRETMPATLGVTMTFTKPGLKAPNTTPLNPLQNTGLDNGITPTDWAVEQYTVTMNQYGDGENLNTVGEAFGIVSRFQHNVRVCKTQAETTLDHLCRDALFTAYLGGNTYVTATLGSAGTTVHVDNINGFVAGSSVLIGANTYTVASTTADGTNTATLPAGISGNIVTTTNVSTSDGTAGNGVLSGAAPHVGRPNGRASSQQLVATDMLTMSVLLDAKATLELNNVPPLPSGNYRFVCDAVSNRQLFSDPDFKQLMQGQGVSAADFARGEVASFLGLEFVRTTESYVTTLAGVGKIRRPVMIGGQALYEADFAGMAAHDTPRGNNVVNMVNDIVYTTQAPLDRFNQIIKQSWYYIGGFTCPTDLTANNTIIGTASNAAYKRAVVIEHIG